MAQFNLTNFSVNADGDIAAVDGSFSGRLTKTGSEVLGNRVTKTANYTILETDRIVAYTTLSASRTATLPAANSVPAGWCVTLKDESGNAGTNNLILARAGSDTIDGATSQTISTNYGSLTVYSDGSSKWFTI